MPTKSENLELIEAINRNTAATRSIAIFIVGFIPWFLGGAAMIFFGAFIASFGDPTFGVISVLGAGALVFGFIQTISRSLVELKLSRAPKD
jgi:purine-cytosine permease-like protein